jgi:glutamine amidotransferase
MAKIAPEYFNNILGSTDSELMFHLALTLGLENDVPKAIAEMVRVVEAIGKEKGVSEALWMTLGISDGENLWGFRYGSDGKGPTLYINPSLTEFMVLVPDFKEMYGDFAACLVSEPIGDYQDIWRPIPNNSKVIVYGRNIEMSSFEPQKKLRPISTFLDAPLSEASTT